ncbi:MAG: CoA transferase [Chloroflexi bacterium]|nr:CoA transferase [Chloroflexota bacterium]
MSRPLDGVVVLDLTRFVAGPFCCLQLADLGADVIKVEIPKTGDEGRQIGPFHKGWSLYFTTHNRNKRGITLNLRDSKGKELFRELVARADVVVENYRPGVLDNLGFGFGTLTALKPGIILTSISGFGQTGPASKRAGFDQIAQSMSGIMDVTGFPDGPPVKVGTHVADYLTGVYAALATCAALTERARTGQGRHVDCALYDSMVSFLGLDLVGYAATGVARQRSGNSIGISVPVNLYRTKDGYVVVNAGVDAHWRQLAELIGRPELADDPRFRTRPDRVANADECDRVVEAWTATMTSAELCDVLEREGIAYGPFRTISEVATDENTLARRMLIEVENPSLGRIPALGSAIKIDGVPEPPPIDAPLLGQHNAEIYVEWLGHSRGELAQWQEAGIV